MYIDTGDYVDVARNLFERSESAFLSAVEMQIEVIENTEYRTRLKECLLDCIIDMRIEFE